MLNGLELIEGSTIIEGIRCPYRIDKVWQIVITKGEFTCDVDYRSYKLQAPAMAILLPDQVVRSISVSSDFEGFGMSFGIALTDSMALPVSLQERLFIKSTHFYSITEEVIDAFVSCYKQVSGIMRQESNPYREEIIKHLFSAHYYGLGYYIHGLQSAPTTMTRQQELCDRFITLLSSHFKTHREIDFYADRLCVTNKYLSLLLKRETGHTALGWIERYTVDYIKSCIESTTMTIQQISDELHFPSQSVLGKYFKRVEGISPNTYRKSLKISTK